MANRKVSPLTDTEIRSAKPRDKEYSLPDGNGLQLIIKPDGRKIWEIRYTIEGKAKKTTGGTYPAVSLKDARAKRDELKSKVLNGIDPIQEKKEIKAIIQEKEMEAQTTLTTQFHLITYEWLSTLKSAEITATKRKRAFERDIFPHFCKYDENHVVTSSKQISEITHGELLKIITEKGKATPETASRLFVDCNRLWTYAVSHEYIDLNITLRIDKSVVPKGEKTNYAKITDEKILGELLRSIDTYKGDGGVIVKNVLRFVSLLPLRADNLCKLKWESVNFEKAIITIPRSEMKVKNKNLSDFILPLPHQAISILKEIKEITGWGKWVFHGSRNMKNHVNKVSASRALGRMGFNDEVNGRKQTLHSFRGTFASLARTHHKEHGATFETMEAVLDHQEGNKVVRAYTHKADYTEQMRELLQWWADYLDEVKAARK
ncbi:MAG: integrase arm-type DNA-binding domain-containing protein [Sulfuricurvum sp.]|nr:integrase arm-type DNA-binding domain-containing protein [Sulfuricurvum sp.]MDD5385615.1 integrase arm-type DNA-binding domain-containing protein [Sulfuricurvum sp.]